MQHANATFLLVWGGGVRGGFRFWVLRFFSDGINGFENVLFSVIVWVVRKVGVDVEVEISLSPPSLLFFCIGFLVWMGNMHLQSTCKPAKQSVTER